MEHNLYLNELLTNYAYLKLGIWQTVSKINEWSGPVTSWKTTDIFYDQYYALRFWMKKIKNYISAIVSLTASQYLKVLQMKLVMMLTVIFNIE